MGSLLVETDKVIDKIRSRNMVSRLLKASSDERELTGIEKRLAQMSQRATFQILTIVAEIKRMIYGEGARQKKKKAFRPIKLQLLSTQNVDLSFYPAWVLMRKTGEIVFVDLSFKGHSLYIYTLQQDGSLAKKIFKSPCDNYHQKGIPIRDPVQYFNLLIVQILWREYLAISCSKHKDIKLVDMETLDITTAFNDDQPLGKMCKGWHKLYVEGSLGLLELDCSSTKFTKIREIEIKMLRTETGAYRLKSKYPDIWSFIPPPYNMVMGIELYIPGFPLRGGAIRTVSLDEPHQTVWHLSRKVVDGKIISPCRVVYSSRHDALFVVDKDNMTVWVLNPGTGEVLQSISPRA